ncbi:hypothetical protein V8F33_012082 [Rhypophila sp. PSN 637]
MIYAIVDPVATAFMILGGSDAGNSAPSRKEWVTYCRGTVCCPLDGLVEDSLAAGVFAAGVFAAEVFAAEAFAAGITAAGAGVWIVVLNSGASAKLNGSFKAKVRAHDNKEEPDPVEVTEELAQKLFEVTATDEIKTLHLKEHSRLGQLAFGPTGGGGTAALVWPVGSTTISWQSLKLSETAKSSVSVPTSRKRHGA